MNFASVTILVFVLDLAVKATALLVIGLVIQQVLARLRASLGSTAANACLIGLLLLPVSALVLPTIMLDWLPAGAGTRPETRSSAVTNSVPARSLEPPRDSLDDMPISDRSTIAATPTAREIAGSNAVSVAAAPVKSEVSSPLTASAPSHGTDWLTIGLTGYGIVVVAFLARLIASLVAVAQLRGSSTPVDAPEWLLALERCRRRLGTNRAVDLAWSARVNVPVVLGWLRPTIVLPASLARMDMSGHADAVLLHELSHVRRGDYPWNIFLRLVEAIYWPHPLVWVLGRAIAELRERACDDLCVHELGGPTAYRQTLVAVARGMSHRASPALGLAMARLSRLSHRLARIEESRGDARCLPSLPARLAIVATAAAASVALGTIQLNRAEARSIAPLVAAQDRKIEKAAVPPDGKGRVFHLRVVEADTLKPVPNADVRIWVAFDDEWRKTDADGRLDIVYSTGPSDRDIGIDVWGDGRAMQRHRWANDPNKPIPDSATVSLQPGETLGGTVNDEQGRPIGGATIFVWSHNFKRKAPHELLYDLRAVTGPDGRWRTSGAPETNGELLGFTVDHPDYLSTRAYSNKTIIPKIADLRAEKAVTIMKKGVPIEGRVVDSDGKPVAGARVLSMDDQRAMFASIKRFAVTTDADGRFRTGQVKSGEWFLVASARGHAPADQSVKVGMAIPQIKITLGQPRAFKGRVVDLEGKPIAGAFVDPDTWKRTYRCLGAYLWTDADGRFRWDDAPNDDLIVNVQKQGYVGVFQQQVAPTVEDIVFTVGACLPVHGTVRDAETKNRVENATLEFGAVDPKTGTVANWSSPPQLGSSTGISRGTLRVNLPVTADSYKIRIQSPGYQTFLSREFRREEKTVLDYDVMLVPGVQKGPLATVHLPDGKPLAGARVYSASLDKTIDLDNGLLRGVGGNGREDRTGPDGTFVLPQSDRPWFVLILGNDAFAFASSAELVKAPKIEAKPYGGVEGRCLTGSRPVPDQEIELSGDLISQSTSARNVFFSQKTKTDHEGRFAFKNVIASRSLRVNRRDPAKLARGIWSIGQPVRVEPGATAHVMLGGKGRPVIGRVEPPAGWTTAINFSDRSEARIESNRPFTPIPFSLLRGKTSMAGADLTAWHERWRDSPESLDYHDRRVSAGVALAPDGSFRIDDVPAGEYRLAIRVNGESIHHVTVQYKRNSGPFAHIIRVFTVPPVPNGRSDEPIDVGVLRLTPRVTLKAGEPAPAFKVTTVDGRKLSVPEDFRGKFLLIDFGSLWDIAAPHQITLLNEVYQKFGADARFAILSLTLAADNAQTRKSIEDKGEPWPQAIVGPLSNTIASAYAIDEENVSTATLIGPDGRIVASELWSAKIREAIGEALGLGEK